MNFPEKLKFLREKNGLTQDDLAKLLNISRQSISKWESGQSYPDIDHLIELSKIYTITLDQLIKDDLDLSKDNKEKDSKYNCTNKNRSSSLSWREKWHERNDDPFFRKSLMFFWCIIIPGIAYLSWIFNLHI